MPVSAKKLRELRIAKGLSQDQFARVAGVPYTTYITWEQGRVQPNPDALRKLAKYHKVPMESLFED